MEIKDYLHLYIGCEVKAFFEQTGKIETGYLTGIHGEYGPEIQFIIDGNAEESPEYVDYDKVKPILRNLSDMTEEELKQTVAGEWGNTHTFTEHYCKKKIAEISKSSHGLFSFLAMYGTKQSLPYLFKQRFDLFELIPAGLAIDKTSLI